MPVIGKEDPRCQIKWVQRPRSVERARQQSEISFDQFCAAFQQAHSNEEIPIRKKRTPERRDADRKTGGPRYLLWTGSVHKGATAAAVEGMITAPGDLSEGSRAGRAVRALDLGQDIKTVVQHVRDWANEKANKIEEAISD